MDRTLTFGDLDLLSRHFAAYLQRVARLRPGDRIALMLPNVLQYPVAIIGQFRAGLVVVNTNPMYTPRELQHQLHDSGSRAIVILENFAHTLEAVHHEIGLDTVIVTGVGDLLGFPKSSIVNFALRHVRRQVPEWSLPGAVGFMRALDQGRYENLEPVVPRTGGRCVPAIHRWHDGCVEGRRTDAPQSRRERPAGRSLDAPAPRH
jgi:long-chain acyl-CoA synthetase